MITQTQMFTDDQILDAGFRKKIITEINGVENVGRKTAQQMMLQLLRDGVRPYVLARLKKQGFKADTLAIMEQRAHSINLMKKIVGKKARSYSKGVNRSVEEESPLPALATESEGVEVPDVASDIPESGATEDIETVAELMGLNSAMKRADRYRKCAKNCMVYVYPEKVEDPENPGQFVMSLTTKVYFPHLYDAIPDGNDKEKMRCLILSPFSSIQASQGGGLPALNGGDGRNILEFSNPVFRPDGVDQTIANSPQDDGANPKKREYVFWTAQYHLTCDASGELIPDKTPEGALNPIKRMPAVNLAEEQDGEFWAQGGDDLMEGSILLNLKLTDMESVLHMQGWGQLVITGQDLGKKDFAVGPQTAMLLSTASDATHPSNAQILQHNPHTAEHLQSVELLVALLLTTNNLSVKSVATNLNTSTVASAIAKMVDESENMDDITEDQEYYACKEKEILTIANAWLQEYDGTDVKLHPDLAGIKTLEVSKMSTQFHNIEAVVTESEKLTNLKVRKGLGIDSMVDLIKKDNPQLSDAQAEAKLMKNILETLRLRKLDPLFGLDQTTGRITENLGPDGQPIVPGQQSASGAKPPPVVVPPPAVPPSTAKV